MSETSTDQLVNALRAALAENARLRRQTAARSEPIAVVGTGCRLPGEVNSAADLWRLVSERTDAIGPFPADRGWQLDSLFDAQPDRPGASYAREGGFRDDATMFDAEFFGISPIEAVAMDPQQRVLLEVAWQTLEDAYIDPVSLRGQPVGVFIGTSAPAYGPRSTGQRDNHAGYLLTGTTPSVVSGRLAYFFGFEGPAITVDTACSSSLVSIHLACRSLRAGECSMALAGGVTIMATPFIFTELAQQLGLSPDSRCKSFANAADGTAWGEGAGLLLLERLSTATRNGHRVLAVIRGSAVNQDGASNGLTAPNGPSQERVIRQALADAGLDPGQVDAVEAHGTGTRLGDPIEARAVAATYGQDRPPDQPVRLGSVKSNIGHLQCAAGVAGAIKMIMALRHESLPPTLHVDRPTDEVDWTAGSVELLTEARPWPETGHTRRAAVSSFGISGTNAHVILEQAPPEPDIEISVSGTAGAITTPCTLVPLSAKSWPALREFAVNLGTHLATNPDLSLTGVAHTLATRRAQLSHRAVVLAENQERLRAGLAALAEGRPSQDVVQGKASAGRTVFVFPGQGGQHAGMAAQLYRGSRLFREHIHACSDVLAPHVDWSLIDVLTDTDDTSWLDRVDIVQPALWAVMVSLARLWEGLGVRPDAVVGHSQGEIAAAHIAGALTLDDAAKAIALRSRALTAIAGTGGMAVLELPAEQVGDLLGRWENDIAIAAVNSPTGTVISGTNQALDEFLDHCGAHDISARRLHVDYPAHHPKIDLITARIQQELAGITPRPGDIPFYSTVTGRPHKANALDGAYWADNLRRPVVFQQAILALLAAEHRMFVEISSHPVLTPAIVDTAQAPGGDTAGVDTNELTVTGTLSRDKDDIRELLTAAATVHTAGVRLDWDALHAGTDTRPVDLPTYPFQHQRFWFTTPATDPAPDGDDEALDAAPAESWSARLSAMPAGQREDAILDVVRTHLATVLGHDDPTQLDPRTSFRDLGVSSMAAVRLCKQLGQAIDMTVPPATLFGHPTCQRFARHLLEQLSPEVSTSPSDWDPETLRSATDEQLIKLLDERHQTSGRST